MKQMLERRLQELERTQQEVQVMELKGSFLLFGLIVFGSI